jgi:hypothetical protein
VTTATVARRKAMSSDTIENATPAPDGGEPKPKCKSIKKGLKKAAKANKTSKPKEERANKNAELIALMKRAKGATLAEIIKSDELGAAHRPGFVSILRKKGGENIESSKSVEGERTYRIK